MKKIAFFDFDGTITTKDTMLELIKLKKGKAGFYFGFLMNSPYLVAYKIKIISNQLAKEKVLKYFFKGTSLTAFQSFCDAFAADALPLLVRPGAINEINKLKTNGFEIVVVSASAENWIKKWCDKLGLKIIATQLETNDGNLTGNLSGLNCHGDEKVARIRAGYDLALYSEIYCYGDTGGDKPMLALGTKAFYKPFR